MAEIPKLEDRSDDVRKTGTTRGKLRLATEILPEATKEEMMHALAEVVKDQKSCIDAIKPLTHSDDPEVIKALVNLFRIPNIPRIHRKAYRAIYDSGNEKLIFALKEANHHEKIVAAHYLEASMQ